jgi:hypothetical protein
LLAGHPAVAELLRDHAPATVVEALTDLSALSHHRALARGVIGMDDLTYFVLLTTIGLMATAVSLFAVRALPINVLGKRLRPMIAYSGLLGIALVSLTLASRYLGQIRIDLTEESSIRSLLRQSISSGI